MKINIKIDGIDDFVKKIGEESIEKVLNKSIEKSIFILEREAKLITPVDTGLLRNSYETKFKYLEGRLRNFREYAPFVEARVGFMARTLNDNIERINKIFENDINKFLEDLTK